MWKRDLLIGSLSCIVLAACSMSEPINGQLQKNSSSASNSFQSSSSMAQSGDLEYGDAEASSNK